MNQTGDAKGCRLLYLVGQLSFGGLERQLNYLITTLDRERYKPAVVVWNFQESDPYVERLRAAGVSLIGLSAQEAPPAKLRKLRRLVRELKPEVLHSYSFFTNVAAFCGTAGTRTLAVGSLRSDFTHDRHHTGRWLGKVSARWPRDIICNSRTASVNVQQARGYFVPRRTYVVRNGMDLQHFAALPMPREASNQRAHIVGIGSLRKVKRWDRFLTVIAEVKRAGYDCSAQIVGEGPLRSELEAQTRELGLQENLQFVGLANDVRPFLASATLLLHTANNEGCPNAVMEAMACARPVVSTDAGDVPDLVRHGQTGFVATRGDDAALLSSVLTLLKDRELCQRMGKAARHAAEDEFGLDRLVAQTLAAYRQAGWRDGL